MESNILAQPHNLNDNVYLFKFNEMSQKFRNTGSFFSLIYRSFTLFRGKLNAFEVTPFALVDNLSTYIREARLLKVYPNIKNVMKTI